MPKTKTHTVSAADVAHEILTKAGKPMPVKEIVAAVIADPRTKLGGKTPEATVAHALYMGAKSGVLFKKTARGRFTAIAKVEKAKTEKPAGAKASAAKKTDAKKTGGTSPAEKPAEEPVTV